MNDKDLIKAYKDLKNSEAPDLWSRIESSLNTASLADEVNGNAQEQQAQTTRPNKILPIKKYNKFIFSSAAVILVVLVATAVIGSPLLNKSFDKAADDLSQSINKSEDLAPNIAESSHSQVGNHDSDIIVAPTTPVAPGYVADSTTTADSDAFEDRYTEQEPNEEIRGETSDDYKYFSDMPETYAELKLADVQPVKLPTVTAAQSPQTKYFTLDAFADTDLLIQATVQSINFIYNDKQEAKSVVYTVLADNVYYSTGEYPTMARYSDGTEMLTIISPIVRADDVWMYPLQTNRTYLLPLTVTNSDVINLVFPYAPQIELSLDGFCVFHSGWQALIDDDTQTLLVGCVHPDDYFYDRMMVRPSNGFAKELTRLIKSLKN